MWVCVHDQVFGGKSRHLAESIGCSQDEAVGLLVRLWIWGLTNCDRTGLIQFADSNTIADVLVQGLSKKLKPNNIVDAMIECEYLDTDGKTIYIHDWADWQKYWYSYQDRKNKDAESKRNARANEAKRLKAAKPDKNPPSRLSADGHSSEPVDPEYPAYFEAWWRPYPRKIGKVDAFKKYQARRKEGYSEIVLLNACMNYASECKKKKTEKEYIMHPKRFLGPSLPFKDYIKEMQGSGIVNEAESGSWINPFERWRERDE